MENIAVTSPFDGCSGKEIEEKWLVWQKHHAYEMQSQTQMQTDSRSVKAENLPRENEREIQRPVFRHSRYDAVMKRMQYASKQTGNYTPVS